MKNITPKIILLLCVFLCFIFHSTCIRLEEIMLVSTVNITNISTNTADATGQVIDPGEGVIQHGHCYSKTPNVTIEDSVTRLGAEVGRGNFTSHLVNLESGTEYYIKAYMSSGNKIAYGDEINFLTASALEPVLTTKPISSITTVSAITGGNITDDGGAPITAYGVCWNIATYPTCVNSKTNDGTGKGEFSSTIIGLTANTTYFVRAYATNSKMTSYGNEISFTTNALNPTPPAAATAAATSLTNCSATLNGAVIANGSSTDISFEYGPTILYGCTIIASPGSITGMIPISVSAGLTGLTPGTIYHFRIKAVNVLGTSYSTDLPFSTSQVPEVTIDPVTSISNTTATLNGKVNAVNLSTLVSFEYGPSISYGSTAVTTPNPVFGVNPVCVNAVVTGLNSGTTYHFRIKAISTGGTTYSDDYSFTTLMPPTAATSAATSVSNSTATLNGIVNANNSSTSVSFEYGLTTSYGSVSNAVQSPVGGSTSTIVNAGISGLTSNTTYHFRLKAVSIGGTTYSMDNTFTTLEPPTATTSTATSISRSTATLNGIVNANNSSTIVSFEYGLTTSYGLVSNAVQSPVSGSISTIVNVGISGLTSNTTYHFRLKAVSNGGTAFGLDNSFKTNH